MFRPVLMLTALVLVLQPLAAASSCPAAPELDGERTMALQEASRAYFDLSEEEALAAIEADLGRDPETAEEAAALLGSMAAAPTASVAAAAAALYPERAPAMLASILVARSWLDETTSDALLVDLLEAMITRAPDASSALLSVAAEQSGRDVGMLSATLGVEADPTDVRCALERGTAAADTVLTVYGH